MIHNFRNSDSTVADSSTDLGQKDKSAPAEVAAAGATAMTKNIVNYANPSELSIASVVSGTPMQAQAIPNQPKTSSQASSKISLVPTSRLLLKPQAINSFKSTPTIVYSSVNSSSAVTGTVTTNAQSSMPMKVVFVNALNNNANAQHGAQKTQQITINNKSFAQLQQSQNSAFLANKLMSSQGQKVQIVQSSHFNSVPKVTTTVNNGESSGARSSKGLLGSKSPGEA